MAAEVLRRGFLVVASLAALALLVVEPEAVASGVYLAVGACAIVIGALALGRVVPWRSRWAVVLGGAALWLLADAAQLLGSSPLSGSGVNPGYLAGEVVVLLAVLQLGRARAALDRSGLIVGLMFVAGWSLVGLRVFTGSTMSAASPVVMAAYLVLDATTVVVLVAVARRPAGSLGERMLVVGVGLTVVADTVHAIGGAARPQQSLWLVMYVLVGTAPWYADRPVRAARGGRRTLLWRDVALMALASVAGPATLLALGASQHAPDLVLVALSQLAVVGLLMVRVHFLLNETALQARQVALLAETDALTGLPNGSRFAAEVDAHLQAGHSDPMRPTVLVIGLTDFADLNERLGHRAGDQLVRGVAERITSTVPEAAAVAHLSAEMFAVLLIGQTAERAQARAQRLAEALRDPLELPQLSVAVRPAIGLATATGRTVDAAELLTNADLALAAARGASGPVVRFSTDLERRDALAAQLVGELGEAITRGEVVVYFQPQVELATGRVTGAEALVRWMHPALGLLAPAAFVPAAEATGTIRVITLHVLDQALYWCARWNSAGRPLNVAVNLSARDLIHSRLVEDVREALVRYGLPASKLELEITETMAMADVELSHRVLTELARLGVTISVDDYGTGYGSLAYLQQLPVRRLKIDRSFVSRMLDDEASTAIVRSTIELAGELGLDTVAEGVEDDATLQRLREFGCSTVQGFGLAAPMSPEGFERAIWRLEHRGRPLRPAATASGDGARPVTGTVAAYPSVARAYRRIADGAQHEGTPSAAVPAAPVRYAPAVESRPDGGREPAGARADVALPPAPVGPPVVPTPGVAAPVSGAYPVVAAPSVAASASPGWRPDAVPTTRRALRNAAQPSVPHPGAGAVSGLRAAAASERTTGVDPA